MSGEAGEEDSGFAQAYSPSQLLVDGVRRRDFFRQCLEGAGRLVSVGAGVCESAQVGQQARQPNPWKDAFHLALLCLAVAREGLSRFVVSLAEALRQLEAKAAAFEARHGSFLPSAAEPSAAEPRGADAQGLGALAWAVYFAARALHEVGEEALARRFEAHLQALRASLVRLGAGRVPEAAGVCEGAGESCDGELFCLFLDLLGDWRGIAAEEREAMWQRRLASGASERQAWKHLLLPYSAVAACRQALYRRAEARAQGRPRLLRDPDAAEAVCGALLVDEAVGAAWLHAALSEGAQTPWGVAESDGGCCGETVALAVLGGVGPMMRRFLERDRLFDRFSDLLARLYPRTGPGVLRLPPPHTVEPAVQWEEAELGLDLELAQAEATRRGAAPVAPCDAPALSAVRRWFEAHEGTPGAAAYCLTRVAGEAYDAWYTTPRGHYDADGEAAREELYRHVVACEGIGLPLVLLARQPLRYPLFFDLDLYGPADGSRSDELSRIAWEGEDKLLVRAIVESVREVYPQFREGLDLAVFSSSGICSMRQRFKASFHLVFPDIIVDRPQKCHPAAGIVCDAVGLPSHIMVRNHVICRLTERMEHLQEQLQRCCGADDVEGPDGEPTYLNDWTEVFDEWPMWHEPSPEAATGLRLPYTDKPGEGRPKRPLGRWRFAAPPAEGRWPPRCPMQRLPDLEPPAWVRLGDIAACTAACATEWDRDAVHEQALAAYVCLGCRG